MDGHHLPPQSNQHRDYKAAAAATDDEEWPEYSKRKPQHNRRTQLIALMIVVVLLIAAAVVFFVVKPQKVSVSDTKSSTTNPQPAPQVTGANAKSKALASYVAKGSDLNLSFSYPSSWTATPESGTDTNNEAITLNSPSTTIQTADGTSETGKVTVMIRPGSATISELNANNPVAAQDSTQFAYSQPTAAQYQYPYITYVHFSTGSTAAGAFEETIITGTQPFTTGSPVTSDSLSGLDPVISASFYRCSTTVCAGTGAGVLSITNSTWQNVSIFQQVEAVFESMKLN